MTQKFPRKHLSKDGQDHKDKYFDTSGKTLSQEMTMYNMEALLDAHLHGMSFTTSEFHETLHGMSFTTSVSRNSVERFWRSCADNLLQ